MKDAYMDQISCLDYLASFQSCFEKQEDHFNGGDKRESVTYFHSIDVDDSMEAMEV
jgi:hypothetical protein